MRTIIFLAPQRVLIILVRCYQFFLSPWLGNHCRFEPTCSAYSLQALQTRGAMMGSFLTFCRIVRCHPWCRGGHDPVFKAKKLISSTDASEPAIPCAPPAVGIATICEKNFP